MDYFYGDELRLHEAVQKAEMNEKNARAELQRANETLAKIQATSERSVAHRTVLRTTVQHLMAETDAARRVVLDVASRRELCQAFWLSRKLRGSGVTICDLQAASDRLGVAWAKGQDTLSNTLDKAPT